VANGKQRPGSTAFRVARAVEQDLAAEEDRVAVAIPTADPGVDEDGLSFPVHPLQEEVSF